MARSRYWGKNAHRAAKKELRKMHPATFIIPILFLIIGLAVGYFASGFVFKNDGFSLAGEKAYTVTVGSDFTYTEEGFTCTALGRDLSDTVSVKSNIPQNEDGSYTLNTDAPAVYYISYTCTDTLFYTDLRLVRAFYVVEAEVGA